jgi:hypothetical protein
MDQQVHLQVEVLQDQVQYFQQLHQQVVGVQQLIQLEKAELILEDQEEDQDMNLHHLFLQQEEQEIVHQLVHRKEIMVVEVLTVH